MAFGPVKDSPWSLQRRLLGGNGFEASLFFGLLVGAGTSPIYVIVPVLALGIGALAFSLVCFVLVTLFATVVGYLAVGIRTTRAERRETIVWYPSWSFPPRPTGAARRQSLWIAGVGAIGSGLLAISKVVADGLAAWPSIGLAVFALVFLAWSITGSDEQ